MHYSSNFSEGCASTASGICSVRRLFLGPEDRGSSWADGSLPAGRNKSGNSTT